MAAACCDDELLEHMLTSLGAEKRTEVTRRAEALVNTGADSLHILPDGGLTGVVVTSAGESARAAAGTSAPNTFVAEHSFEEDVDAPAASTGDAFCDGVGVSW